MKALLKKILPSSVIRILQNRDIDLSKVVVLPSEGLTYKNDLLFTYHNADFIQEKKFAEAYALVKQIGGKLLENYDIQWRIHVVCWAASHAAKLEGDFVDCGVYSGFSPRAVCHFVDFERLNKTYYLMDTFSGMDQRYSSDYEMERNKKLGYSEVDLYQQVKETFKDFKTKIIKGAIPDTLPQADCQKVSFLSIDMNSVLPEVAALEYFWPKLVSGGIVVLDDYGYPGCIDQKKAHDQFAESKGVKILSMPTCQGMIIKP
ncbi:MAG: TylF/MycF/NovP-related O-methyltransferase [Bacteroidota bacterium]|jgi:O-methyltransferase